MKRHYRETGNAQDNKQCKLGQYRSLTTPKEQLPTSEDTTGHQLQLENASPWERDRRRCMVPDSCIPCLICAILPFAREYISEKGSKQPPRAVIGVEGSAHNPLTLSRRLTKTLKRQIYATTESQAIHVTFGEEKREIDLGQLSETTRYHGEDLRVEPGAPQTADEAADISMASEYGSEFRTSVYRSSGRYQTIYRGLTTPENVVP